MDLTVECMLETMNRMKEKDPDFFADWLKKNGMTESEAKQHIKDTLTDTEEK